MRTGQHKRDVPVCFGIKIIIIFLGFNKRYVIILFETTKLCGGKNKLLKEEVTYSPELKYLMKLWQRANNSNDTPAQFNLAKLYLNMKQESANKKAVVLLKKLVNKSHTIIHTDAQFMLAQCYENGCGITKSYQQACKWYEKAYINANNDIYKAFEEKINEELEAVLDKPDNNEITFELVDCVTEAAECGNIDSQKYLMELYQFGSGCIEPDNEKVAYWAERAAENGDKDAMYEIGSMYLYGRGVNRNPEKSFYWLEKSAELGNHKSAYLLGTQYYSQKQYKKAAEWHRLSAESNIKRRNILLKQFYKK